MYTSLGQGVRGASETIAANANGIGSTGVTGRVFGAITKQPGVYRRENGVWRTVAVQDWAREDDTSDFIPLQKFSSIVATETKWNALTNKQLVENHLYIVGG